MRAVMRVAEAYLHALIMMSNSIRKSFTLPEPQPTMKTSSPRTEAFTSTLPIERNAERWPEGRPRERKPELAQKSAQNQQPSQA